MLETSTIFDGEFTPLPDEVKNIIEPSTETKPESTFKKRRLTSETKLVLHTNLAKIIFSGVWHHGRIGLIQFASNMRLMWRAAREDDPYAEWYLLKVYDAIEKAKKQIKQYEALLLQQMNQMRGFKIDLFKDPNPIEESLRFSTPFAFMGAMLLEHFDYVNRQLYTLQRLGLLARDNLAPKHLLKEMQSVFVLPTQWKYTGVTRKDIAENNPVAQKAFALLGQLPEPILRKEIKFAFLPKPLTQPKKETEKNAASTGE